MSIEKRIVELYDEYVATDKTTEGVKVSDAKIAIRDAVRRIVEASDRDVERETDLALDRSIAVERGRRSRSIKSQIDFLLDGFSEDGAYIDPMLDKAFSLGDTHGMDKALRNWTGDDLRNLVVTRYRVSADSTNAASELDHSTERLLEKMKIENAPTIGTVPWDFT